MSKSRRHSKSQNSNFEQSFILQNAFKRNKRYIDYKQLNKAQHEGQYTRRRPFSSSEKSVDQKITNSFLNTTNAFSDKLEQDIGKFKHRMSSSKPHETLLISEHHAQTMRSFSSKSVSQIRNSYSASSCDQYCKKKKIPGMALDQYCSRQQYYRCKNKPIPDQRLFNNYSEMKPDTVHVRDFAKYSDRDQTHSHHQFKQFEYDTNKLYENYFFNKTHMQCNFRYKKNAKTARDFFAVKKKENQPATELSPGKVKQSYQKCSVTGVKNIQAFYSNTGRQLPSQFDIRFSNNLTNQWVESDGKIMKKVKDYSLRKMKNDLVDKKIEGIKSKKKPLFERKQLCDQMFFRVHPIS